MSSQVDTNPKTNIIDKRSKTKNERIPKIIIEKSKDSGEISDVDEGDTQIDKISTHYNPVSVSDNLSQRSNPKFVNLNHRTDVFDEKKHTMKLRN